MRLCHFVFKVVGFLYGRRMRWVECLCQKVSTTLVWIFALDLL